MLHKMVQLDIPDEVYNWLVSFFPWSLTLYSVPGNKIISTRNHSQHHPRISLRTAASYVVGAADLKAVTPAVYGNELVKFADDTYIVIPAANDSSRQTEVNHVVEWARKNNLKTNPAKFAEIVFVDNRKKKKAHPPPPLPGIDRVTTIKILGVTFTNSLSVADRACSCCHLFERANTLYALRVLRAHGMDDVSPQTIYRSVVIAKLTYASSAWWGFASASDLQRLVAFISYPPW